MKKTEILSVKGREIIDSRGNPTVEAEVVLADGTVGLGKAPSGASTGKFEALELRDGDITRYCGKGVLKAVANINSRIAPIIKGMDAADLYGIDATLSAIDGTKDKSALGANATLAVSMACVNAAANSMKQPLFKFIGGVCGRTLPVPMMNILNGGAHAANNIDVQEFMIMPVGSTSFSEGLQWCSQVFHNLAKILKQNGMSTAVGDEGGFAPNVENDEEAIKLILEAVKQSGFIPGQDFVIALDAAASEWKTDTAGKYKMPKSGKVYNTEELISHWDILADKYPIRSIEDPLDEEDWDGWTNITERMGKKIMLVGDDLFVTNHDRVIKGIVMKAANAVLIKPNQIGTVSETIETVKLAKENGYKVVMSHRSGETEDTFIADLSVALNTGMIKTGAPSRGERTAKYNQLLRIEEYFAE